jgi:cell division protease FtsH
VRELITRCEQRAIEILRENREKLDEIAALLMEREVIEGTEFERLMRGEVKETAAEAVSS